MKHVISCMKEGATYFLFSPVIMFVLWVFVEMGKVTDDSVVPGFLVSFVSWRYSATGFLGMLIFSLFACGLSVLLLKNKFTNAYRKSIANGTFDFFVSLLSKNFMFWSGACFAYSLGSRYIEIIPSISGLEIVALACLFLAVVIKSIIIEAKYTVLGENGY